MFHYTSPVFIQYCDSRLLNVPHPIFYSCRLNWPSECSRLPFYHWRMSRVIIDLSKCAGAYLHILIRTGIYWANWRCKIKIKNFLILEAISNFSKALSDTQATRTVGGVGGELEWGGIIVSRNEFKHPAATIVHACEYGAGMMIIMILSWLKSIIAQNNACLALYLVDRVVNKIILYII